MADTKGKASDELDRPLRVRIHTPDGPREFEITDGGPFPDSDEYGKWCTLRSVEPSGLDAFCYKPR